MAEYLNLCTVCGEDFNSEAAFDMHRQGTFEPLDRYCLMPGEMLAKGMAKNSAGRWVTELMPAELTARRTAAKAPKAGSRS